MEIAIKSKSGIGLRPLPLRIIAVYAVGIIVLFAACFLDISPLSTVSTKMQIMFAIVWIAFTFFCAKQDKAQQMQIELIPALVNYIGKPNRVVLTRHINNALPFYHIVGIDSIDDSGRIVTYTDGTYGIWYSVVGSASILLFPEDRDAILLKVDDFYKKLGPDCEMEVMTAKEPQKVARQEAHIIAQFKHLEYDDPDIKLLVKEQFNALKNFVGKDFKSLHQYLIIKGDTLESLTLADNIIRSECEKSNLVFKSVQPLYREDIEKALSTIYKEPERE
jgi:hypothetical protein